MWKCRNGANVKIGECGNVEMGGNVKTGECGNEKMSFSVLLSGAI